MRWTEEPTECVNTLHFMPPPLRIQLVMWGNGWESKQRGCGKMTVRVAELCCQFPASVLNSNGTQGR